MSARRYHIALLSVAVISLAGSQLFSNLVVLVNFFQVRGLPIVMVYFVGLTRFSLVDLVDTSTSGCIRLRPLSEAI